MKFVSMEDTFLSGWGNAENKKAIFIYACENQEEAEIVANNAKSRGDQKNIKISHTKPNFNTNLNYVQLKNKNENENWYKVDFFKSEDKPYDESAYVKMRDELESEFLINDTLAITQKLKNYIEKDEVKLYYMSKNISKISIKSAMTNAIYQNTDGYKEDYAYIREGEMFKKLEFITLHEHSTDTITMVMHSSQLNYSVEIIIDGQGHKRGDIIG